MVHVNTALMPNKVSQYFAKARKAVDNDMTLTYAHRTVITLRSRYNEYNMYITDVSVKDFEVERDCCSLPVAPKATQGTP